MSNLDSFIKESVLYYYKGVRFCISALFRFWYVTLILAIVFGYFANASKKSAVYKGSMIYMYNYMDELYYAKQLQDLKNSIGQDAFANTLQLDSVDANSILTYDVKDFRGNNLIDKKSEEITPIYIHFTFKENANVKNIQDAFTNYFNNHPYLNGMIEKNKETTQRRLSFLNREMEIIDSLKRNKYLIGGNIQSLSLDMGALFAESEKKFNEIIELKNMDNKELAIEVFKPLNCSLEVPSRNKRILKYGVVWIVFSIIITSLLAIIKLDKEA